MKLSIVTTLFYSGHHIEEFCLRSVAAARQLVEDDFEIVLVNDGSPDNSLELAVGLAAAVPNIMVVDLSRNFGHHRAMMTGLAHTRGDRVFLIDSDLEEDPAWLRSFSEQMERDGCDVVFGVQERRKGSFFERWSGEGFYFFFQMLTGLALPKNVVTARLMTRRYVDALLDHKEREVYIMGLMYITGFDQRPQIIKKQSISKTTYTLRRKMALLLSAVTSFSNAPLIGIFYIGVALSFMAGIFMVYIFINWLVLATPPSGWTSVIASIWLLGGMTISFIGVVGIYLSKIFSEIKQRPYTIVRQVYGKQAPPTI